MKQVTLATNKMLFNLLQYCSFKEYMLGSNNQQLQKTMLEIKMSC